MKRKTMRHKMLEVSRRVYLSSKGNLKGFGKIAKHYDRNWKANLVAYPGINSYKNLWE